MPLSEEELRLLEQMERELAAEDPKFVATLQGRTLRRSAKLRTFVAAGVFVVGVALMMGGAVSELIWLGVIGFLIMLGSATVGLAAWRGQQAPREQMTAERLVETGFDERRFEVIEGGRRERRFRKPKAAKPQKHGTFMQRLEQRWQDRRNQGY